MVAVAVWRGEPWHAPEHWAAVIAVLAGAAALGSSRALGGSLTDGWPGWARALPRAVVTAQLVLFVAGAAVLATGLIMHLDLVSDLHARLEPGIGGGIVLDPHAPRTGEPTASRRPDSPRPGRVHGADPAGGQIGPHRPRRRAHGARHGP